MIQRPATYILNRMIHYLLESYFVEECNPMRRFDFSYYRRQYRSSMYVIWRLPTYILNRMIHCLLKSYFVEECSPMKRFDFSYYRRQSRLSEHMIWRPATYIDGSFLLRTAPALFYGLIQRSKLKSERLSCQRGYLSSKSTVV